MLTIGVDFLYNYCTIEIKKGRRYDFLGKKKEIPWRIKERRNRRAKRGSERGRELEDWMRKFLKKMCDEGDIDGFAAHAPHSIADREGKDFTVWIKGESHQRVSFGITRSFRQQNNFQLKHPDIPLIVIPHEMTPERIRERVLMLFKESPRD